MDHGSYTDAYVLGILNGVRTIAMVGASANWKRPSYFAMKYLQEKGYRIVPVNPGVAAAGLTVLGGQSPEDLALLRELYFWVPGDVFETTLSAAEMIKYVCNGFHALKIAFANEIGTICKQLAVDAEEVTRIFTADRRLNISPAYLKPGFAFGGSCLPKDLRALSYRVKELDLELPLLDSILPSKASSANRGRSEPTKGAIAGVFFSVSMRITPKIVTQA